MRPLEQLCSALLILTPVALSAQLSGNYTINPVGGNYATIGAAVSALSAQGVSGPVTFFISPGFYPEQVTFQSIAGVSAANTVLFTSSTNTATDVIIGPAPLGGHTIDLATARRVTFQYVTVWADDRGIIGSDPRYCHIKDCVLQGEPGITALASIDLAKATNCSVQRNLITDSEWAVRIGDLSGAVVSTAVDILDNDLHAACTAIDMRTVLGLTIADNFCSIFGDCGAAGVSVTRPSGVVRIQRNKVISYNGLCLLFERFTGSANQRARIVNNMLINLHDAEVEIAFSMTDVSYTDVYHNSMFVRFGYANVAQMYSVGNVRFRGNALSAGDEGLMLFIDGLNGPLTSNHNLFDTPTGYPFVLSPTGYSQATWQALGYDAASVFADPQFVSDVDLHLQNSSPAQNKVPTNTGVTDDIDNNGRPSPINTNADIGCDERVQLLPPPFMPQQHQDGEAAELRTYPNPVSDRLQLTGLEGPGSFVVIGPNGAAVMNGVVQPGQAIDLSPVPNGCYVLRVDGHAEPLRIVVAH